MPETAPARRLRDLVWHALRRSCPSCGGGPVFVSWFRMCPSCPACGLRFDREPEGGYWVGAYSINLFASECLFALALTGGLWMTWPEPPWEILIYGGVALSVLFPLAFYPWSKTLFVAVDLVFRPSEPGDYEHPPEPAPGRVARG
jgi:uncharacterized protein (DUF983 family)